MRTMQLPTPTAMTAFYGGQQGLSAQAPSIDFASLLTPAATLSPSEMDAVDALKGLFGEPTTTAAATGPAALKQELAQLPGLQQPQPPAQLQTQARQGKLIQVPMHMTGMLPMPEAASKKRMRQDMDGFMAALTKASEMLLSSPSSKRRKPIFAAPAPSQLQLQLQLQLQQTLAPPLYYQATSANANVNVNVHANASVGATAHMAAGTVMAPGLELAPAPALQPARRRRASSARAATGQGQGQGQGQHRALQRVSSTGSTTSVASGDSTVSAADSVASAASVSGPGAARQGGKSRYSAFRKASLCPFCKDIGLNCGKVAAKCPNRPCNQCNRRHRLNRCRKIGCKHCSGEHLSSKCPIKIRQWAQASVARRREQRQKQQGGAAGTAGTAVTAPSSDAPAAMPQAP